MQFHGAFFDAEGDEKVVLARRTVDAGAARRTRQGLEIDMACEVGFAGIVQYGGVGVVPYRLEGFAGGALRMAVIDDQASAAMLGNAAGDLAGDRAASSVQLEDLAVIGDGNTTRDRTRERRWLGGDLEGEPAGRADAD